MPNQVLRSKARSQATKVLKKVVASKGKLHGNFYYVGNKTEREIAMTMVMRDPKGATAASLGKKLKADITGNSKFARGTMYIEGSKLFFHVTKGNAKSLKDAFRVLKKQDGLGLLKKAFIASTNDDGAEVVEFSGNPNARREDQEFNEAEFLDVLLSLPEDEKKELMKLESQKEVIKSVLETISEKVESALNESSTQIRDMLDTLLGRGDEDSVEREDEDQDDGNEEDDETDDDLVGNLKEVEGILLRNMDDLLTQTPVNMAKLIEERTQLAELKYAGEDLTTDIGKPLDRTSQHMMSFAFLEHSDQIESLHNKIHPELSKDGDGSQKTTLQRIREGEPGGDDTVSPEYIASLMVDAMQTQKKLTSFLDDLTIDGVNFEPSFKEGNVVKGTERIFEKWDLKYKEKNSGFESFTDISRGSIVYDTPNDLLNSHDALLAKFNAQNFVVVNEKNRFKGVGTDDDHYRDFLLNLQIPLGNEHSHICELQLHLKSMVAAKSNKQPVDPSRYSRLRESAEKLYRLQKDESSPVNFTEKAVKKLTAIAGDTEGTLQLSGHDLYDVKRYLFENQKALPAEIKEEYKIWSEVASEDMYAKAWMELQKEHEGMNWQGLYDLTFMG